MTGKWWLKNLRMGGVRRKATNARSFFAPLLQNRARTWLNGRVAATAIVAFMFPVLVKVFPLTTRDGTINVSARVIDPTNPLVAIEAARVWQEFKASSMKVPVERTLEASTVAPGLVQFHLSTTDSTSFVLITEFVGN